jgi:hypothetical protein
MPAPVTEAVRYGPALRAQEIDMRDEDVSLSETVLLLVAAYNPPLDFKTRHRIISTGRIARLYSMSPGMLSLWT